MSHAHVTSGEKAVLGMKRRLIVARSPLLRDDPRWNDLPQSVAYNDIYGPVVAHLRDGTDLGFLRMSQLRVHYEIARYDIQERGETGWLIISRLEVR